eukprot:scaffold15662_cov109-Isochrysis_galbana.AAC.15
MDWHVGRKGSARGRPHYSGKSISPCMMRLDSTEKPSKDGSTDFFLPLRFPLAASKPASPSSPSCAPGSAVLPCRFCLRGGRGRGSAAVMEAWLGARAGGARLPVARLSQPPRRLLAQRELLGEGGDRVGLAQIHGQVRLDLGVVLEREEEVRQRHVVAARQPAHLLHAPLGHRRRHVLATEIKVCLTLERPPVARLVGALAFLLLGLTGRGAVVAGWSAGAGCAVVP